VHDADQLAELTQRRGGAVSALALLGDRVPYLDEDVHDLAGLAEINRYLFASSEERIELAAGRA